MIVNARHARCGPCRSFGLLTFGPAPDRTLERDLAAVGYDLDALRVDLGAADEGVLDLLLDVVNTIQPPVPSHPPRQFSDRRDRGTPPKGDRTCYGP